MPAFMTWLAMVLLLVGLDTSPVLIKTFRSQTVDEQRRHLRENAVLLVDRAKTEHIVAVILAAEKLKAQQEIDQLESQKELSERDRLLAAERYRADKGSDSYRDAQRFNWTSVTR